MPTVLPMTRVEAYLAYKAGVIAESDLKPSLKTNFYSGLENWLAYWCGLTSDYPKDENNDPKWYTEEEYYVAYLCGIAPDYPVNCYRRVGAYLRYIISARWDRPEKPLTREEYYLSLMSTTYLPPNDPASIITLDNTAEAPFGDLKIFGDTQQTTYTGKNLFKYTAITSAVRCSYTDTDGKIVCTATGDNPSVTVSVVQIPAGTYTCSGSLSGVTASPRDGNNASLNVNFSSVPKTITTAAAMAYITFYSSATTGQTFTIDLSDFQIETGSTATAYEPYVGGSPSPSPEYPEPISVVTGDQTVYVRGKNLFNGQLEMGSLNGNTGGETDSTTNMRNVGFIPVKPNTIYRLNAPNYPSGSNYYWYEYKADQTYNLTTNKGSTSGVFTTNEGTYYIRFRFVGDYVDLNAKIMLSEGTTAQAFTPFAKSYEINLGKNLWGGFASDYHKTLGDISFTTKQDGTIEVGSGTATTTAYSMSSADARNSNMTITLPAGTYTISGSVGNIAVLLVNSSNGNQIATSQNGVKASVTLSEELSVFVRAQIANGQTVTATTIKPQLETGSAATPYAPYFTQIELCKIGDYQDVIYRNVQTSGKNLLAHTEDNWSFSTADGRISSTAGRYAQWSRITGGQTYTASRKEVGGSSYYIVAFFDSEPAVGSTALSFKRADAYATSLSITADAPALATYAVVFYGSALSDEGQLELGPVATSYEPHENPYYDSDLPEGAWCIHKAIGKIIWSGSADEYWSYTSGAHPRFTIQNSTVKRPASTTTIADVKSDNFTPASVGSIYSGQDCAIGIHSDYNQFWVSYFTYTSADDFKTWLSTHNTTVYYALATPTDTQITDATLISQLDALLEGGSYATQTNITLTAAEPNLPGLLQVTAAKYQ